MKKSLLTILIAVPALLSGKFTGMAVESCGAFNNLKHTKNSGNVTLKRGNFYQINREHKGQYLIKVNGENPPQRWVDKECILKTDKKNISKKESLKDDKNLVSVLVLSWQNSFCETHRNRKECKVINSSKEPSRLTLHGLWPQPRNNQYCGVDKKIISKDKHRQWRALPKPKVSKDVEELMKKYLPGYISGLDRHEWIKHGTCYSKDSNKYFHDSLKLTEEIDNSLVGDFLRENEGKKINLVNLQRVFDKAFGKGSGKHIEMRCKNGLLTEIWIHIKGKGDSLKELLKDAPIAKSKCRTAIVDAKGYFKRGYRYR